MIVLGIDPGSRITGYGVIEIIRNTPTYIASGCIRLQEEQVGQRLAQIFDAITDIIGQFQPTTAAIEEIFFHVNPRVALKLGQARGVALVAMARYGLDIAEYSARQVKQSVVGYGAASKTQIQHMIRYLLRLTGEVQVDAADALAVALCHVNMQSRMGQLGTVKEKFNRGRIQ